MSAKRAAILRDIANAVRDQDPEEARKFTMSLPHYDPNAKTMAIMNMRRPSDVADK